MSHNFSRRTLIKGALAAAAPALLPAAAWPQGREVDVVIVGAGAAGIGAARRLASQGRSHVVLEAMPRIGGRVTASAVPLGTPCDLGAHRLFAPAQNPVAAFARSVNFDLYTPQPSRRLYIGMREARDGEYDDFTSSVRRAARAITAVGEAGRDVPAADVLPELGEWQATAAALLGPLTVGAELQRISTADFMRAADRSEEVASRAGLANLMLAASRAVPIELDTPVRTINVAARRNVTVETAKGSIRANAVIVTASAGVLAADVIRFQPALPDRTAKAITSFAMGVHNRVVFELLGNPLQLKDDETVVFKASGRRTMRLTGRIAGADIAYADIGGTLARELSEAGEPAMHAFVRDIMAEHFGEKIRSRFGWSAVMRWDKEPWVRGSHAVASPGAASSRRTLFEPARDRIFFAGEAVHETMFGTVAGAWLSGERAANAAIRVLPARR